MELVYVGIICLTLIIIVTNVAGHVAATKKRQAELKAEVDKRQIESAFPPEKPEKPTLEQQAFDVKCQREQQEIDTKRQREQQEIDARQKAVDAQRKAVQQVFDAKKQALDHVLNRRRVLEAKIDECRGKVMGYVDKQYAQYRTDALEAMNDARKEQAELVTQQADLLALIEGDDDESQVDTAAKPVRVDPGGPVAERVDDPDFVHDAESNVEEASREGAA